MCNLATSATCAVNCNCNKNLDKFICLPQTDLFPFMQIINSLKVVFLVENGWS